MVQLAIRRKRLADAQEAAPMADEPLRSRVLKGGAWTLGLSVAVNVLNIARLTALARLLSPADFGLAGLAYLCIAALDTFSMTGFQTALVQKQRDVGPYLDSAWTVAIIRGCLLFVALFLLAPLVALFFESPNAVGLIRGAGLVLLVRSLTNVGVVYFIKELDFKKNCFFQIGGTLGDFGISVGLAVLLHNAWALVLGMVAGECVKCVSSFSLHPYRPRLRLDLRRVRELALFGRWILGNSALIYLVTRGDNLVVAKLLGPAALGFYQVAFRIGNMVATELAGAASQVTLPAYSLLQDRRTHLREAYLKTLQLLLTITLPLTVALVVLAENVTPLLLGAKWSPIVPLVKILAVSGCLRAIAATTGPIFNARGKPHKSAQWQLVRLLAFGMAALPCTATWGILGTAWAVLISIGVSSCGFLIDCVRELDCQIRDVVKRIAPAGIASAALAVLLINARPGHHVGFEGLIALCLVAGIGYIILLGVAGALLRRYGGFGSPHLIVGDIALGRRRVIVKL
jgi:lipopolysaccharide exporter